MATQKAKNKEAETTGDETVAGAGAYPLPTDTDLAQDILASSDPTPADDEGKGCMLGGGNWHRAKYRTTDRSASEVRYCEKHKPTNHEDLRTAELD